MHPLNIDPKALPAELTETELDALIRMLHLKGHNIHLADQDEEATWGAKLDERHPQLENDMWYAIGSLLWERAAGKLEADGYTRTDNSPVPVFNKGDTHVYLARKLGSLKWYTTAAVPPLETSPAGSRQRSGK